jgi:serine/threonine protein phosphatase PrpC
MTQDPKEPWRARVSQPLEVETVPLLSSVVALDVAAASSGGRRRTHNTDHYLAMRFSRVQETLVTSLAPGDLPPRFEEHAYVMLVADGLGEDAAGARASRVVLSALASLAIEYGKWNVRISPDTMADIVQQGAFFCRRANDAIVRASEEHPELANMATSLTALYIAEEDLFFSHVGHSRGYLFRDGVLTQLTVDHSLDDQRFAVGRPLPVEGARRDLGHVVIETLGGKASPPDVDIEHLKLSPGDRLLLCTNGLTDVVGHDQIADALSGRRRPLDECRWLIDLAREAKGEDDVTVLVADYSIRPPMAA